MKTMNIVPYLMMIAVFEGALHEYLLIKHVQSTERMYRVMHKSVPVVPKKESAHTWYEFLLSVMHSIWALLIGLVRSVWHGVRESIELIMLCEEAELFHDVAVRLDLWNESLRVG